MAKKPEKWAIWNAHKAQWIGRSVPYIRTMSDAKTYDTAEEALEDCAGAEVPVRISE